MTPPNGTRRAPRQGGFTLLEVTIAGGLLLTAIGLSYVAMAAGLQAAAADTALGEAQEANRAAMARIVRETSFTGMNSTASDDSGLLIGYYGATGWLGYTNAVYFKQNLSWNNATNKTNWSAGFYIGFEWDGYRPGHYEINNGRDDDGDGLVDEGIITLRNQSFQLVAILAEDVNKNFEIREYLDGLQVDGWSVYGNELRFFMQTMKPVQMGEGRQVIYFPRDDKDPATDDRMVQSVDLRG